ncbi:hypothetical protein D3870_07080 [Noviherbaspirillum cavernae]|uniref:Uncharacterized protein n=1 Tax=Noviherbaspirillum cavernae TaxID=2320862 RepID=A0A418X029_9BURK|nr:hypothetical protein [Noviherbaspirillum cavernae]RJG05812.1 hypothetical protein D3870_07080 [Noviherbaspirillum cavernae]
MSSKQSFSEFMEQKNVRLTLAAVCVYFAIGGLFQLLTGDNGADWFRGGGGFLLWGGWAVINALKPYGRSVPGINIAVNAGLVMIVASWIARN